MTRRDFLRTLVALPAVKALAPLTALLPVAPIVNNTRRSLAVGSQARHLLYTLPKGAHFTGLVFDDVETETIVGRPSIHVENDRVYWKGPV